MGIQANLEDMSEEEKIFYMFKAHDNDNNNALDGLEMIHSAMHHNYDYFKNSERDNYLQNASEELEHFIEAIDKFLLIADENNDGLLHYPEIVKAISGGKEHIDVDRNMLR
ncbi:multiple coagulation factor deficiency protein 2 homolog isoform X2 [Drosophila willistoni]|nr:multiple coagulation factor deficiency protein 2 homolog isoform X2 [Drosophila willistoni]